MVGLTSTLTDRFINEFRFGANRTDPQFNCDGVSTFDSFGFVDVYGRGADYGTSVWGPERAWIWLPDAQRCEQSGALHRHLPDDR